MHAIQHSGATAPGSAAPKSDEAPTGGTVRGFEADDTEQGDSASAIGAEQGTHGYRKRVASCTAKLAMLGFEMYPLVGASFVIARWNMSRTVADIDDAERFLAQIGGRS